MMVIPETVQAAVPDGPNRVRLVRFLAAAIEQGCTPTVPDAVKQNYLNIQPPVASRRRGRIAAITTSTGSVEFQNGSWDRLRDKLGFRFVPAGRKTARHLNTDTDVRAVIAALIHEITLRA